MRTSCSRRRRSSRSRTCRGHTVISLRQVNARAIAPLGEARSNVVMFGVLARQIGFTESCFDDREDALIDPPQDKDHPWFAGITRERLEREGQSRVAIFRSTADRRDVAVQHGGMVHRRRVDGGEFLPVPEFIAPGRIAGPCSRGGLSRSSFCRARRTTI